jgi:RNA polymerase subunit RPABC4/transcription elongation factor Spt4/uncharacterized protein (DUF697 family)
MTVTDDTTPGDEENIRKEVSSELEKAKEFAKTLSIEDVKSGQWFVELLKKVVESYDRNARASYFHQKYPGLPPDDIAAILRSVTVRYATIAGALAGLAASANQIALLSTAGMTAALFVTTIGAEMIYLARLQMRLVLDLAVVYGIKLDSEDPEDILMIFGYAVGVTPTELLGKGLQVVTATTTKGLIKTYISKTTLKAIQDFARKLGFKILQRTIIKYTVPIASAAVGSSYNYVTTKSVGAIAQNHFKHRGKMTHELTVLLSQQKTYDLAFAAAVWYLATSDGQFSQKEKELYKSMLALMNFEEHTQIQFQRLTSSEKSVLEAIASIDDQEVRFALMETLILMAIYDGELAVNERAFLVEVAKRLNISIDLADIEQRSKEYQVVIPKSLIGGMTDTVSGAGVKVKNVIGRMFSRKQPSLTCTNCGKDVPADYQFCPGCGQSTATEKSCTSCDKLIPIAYDFCPHCGTTQAMAF